jgi:hypothetical protein
MPDAPKVQAHALPVCQPPQVSNAPLPDKDDKGKDKEDEEGDKPWAKGFKIPKTSSTSSSAATAASPPSVHRNLLCVKSYLSSQPYSNP